MQTESSLRQPLISVVVLLLLAFGIWAAYSVFKPAPKVPVIVYLVDTLRADHLGIYGYDRATSPTIDALARDSVVFENAYATAPWTLPSVASLFTSTFPCEHRVLTARTRLNKSFPTLAAILADQGYLTASIFNNIWVGPDFGLAQGFVITTERGRFVNNRAVDTAPVIDVAGDMPLFLYIHTLEPHDTHWISPEGPLSIDAYFEPMEYVDLDRRMHLKAVKDEFVDIIVNWNTHQPADRSSKTLRQTELMRLLEDDSENMIHLYDASVRIADDYLAYFVELLKAKDIWDNAIVVFLSDHGEEIGEHGGWFHGQSVYEELMRIPLIVHFPEGQYAGRRVTEPVSIVDVMPTILDYLDLSEFCPNCRGESLLDLLERDNPGARASQRAVLMFRADDVNYYGSHEKKRGRYNVALRSQNWKVILNLDPQSLELFNLVEDPGETADVGATETEIATDLGNLAAKSMDDCSSQAEHAPEATQLDQDTRDRLRGLGYIN